MLAARLGASGSDIENAYDKTAERNESAEENH